MKGVILAGGRGTRLYPVTKSVNKHLLPVGREPMIYNPIKQLISSDINEILVVTSKENAGDIINLLGSGNELSCQITYRIQEEALGIAHALSLAESFACGESITVILGDNITNFSIKQYVENFKQQGYGARILLKKVEDPRSYGVALLEGSRVVEIEEKPLEPQSDYIVTGIYMYDNQVFEIIRSIKPSKRNELEITEVNNAYISKGQLSYDFLAGDWADAGTFESLETANWILMNCGNKISETFITI